MAKPLAGRVAIVTGAQSRGIGKGCALELAAAGATVYVTGRTRARGRRRAAGHGRRHRGGDRGRGRQRRRRGAATTATTRAVEALFARVDAEQGRLDVLVNNAFLIPPELTSGKRFFELPISNWDDMIDVGTRSAYVASAFAARRMARRKAGLIANISSSGAAEYAWHVAYGVGKAALDRLTADIAHELRDFGVAVVSLWPGLVLTERIEAPARALPGLDFSVKPSRSASRPRGGGARGRPRRDAPQRPRARVARPRPALRLPRPGRLAARRPARAPLRQLTRRLTRAAREPAPFAAPSIHAYAASVPDRDRVRGDRVAHAPRSAAAARRASTSQRSATNHTNATNAARFANEERQAHARAEAAALEVLRVHGAALREIDHEIVERDQRGAGHAVDRGEARRALAALGEAAQQQVGEVDEPEQQREREARIPAPPVAPRALRPDRTRHHHQRAEHHAHLGARDREVIVDRAVLPEIERAATAVSTKPR